MAWMIEPFRKGDHMAPKEEQIQALLSGDPLRYACEKLQVETMDGRSYAAVFDVTKTDVFAYVRAHGLPFDCSHGRNSTDDGFRFFEEEGKLFCWFQERGIIFDEREFTDYDAGLIYITEILLKLSGTGLY
jgi:hypothetical protein